jgi:thioredoxin 1
VGYSPAIPCLAFANPPKSEDSMADSVQELTDSNFSESINLGVTLVDFWAPWCPPCRAQAPAVVILAEKFTGRARVAKFNVDDNPVAPTKLGIQNIPTLIVFKNGEVFTTFVGLQDESKLSQAITDALE